MKEITIVKAVATGTRDDPNAPNQHQKLADLV